MNKKLFIITGDYSGDIHAAKVVEELKKNLPDIIIEGIGGENLAKSGVKLFSNQKKMGAVGISPKIITDHLTLGKRVADYITNEFKPDLILMIDYGAFNLNLAKVLKPRGFKIFYYIPPQIWASRKWRINTVKRFVDKVLCIFPFEKKMYDEHEIDCKYCGHPLIAQLPPKAERKEFFKNHKLDESRKLVSIFPGSRVFELKNLMKTFLKAAEILKKKHPELQFCISQAPNLSDETFFKYLKKSDFQLVKGENQALLSVSDVLILASGTVSLEAALYQTPMVIAYKGPWLFYMIYLCVRAIKKVSLPNIITGKNIVPELIQYKLSAENIVYNVEKLLYDENYRNNNIKELGEVREKLSEMYSAKEVALEISEKFKHL